MKRRKITLIIAVIMLMLAGCSKKDEKTDGQNGTVSIEDAEGIPASEDISGDYYPIACSDKDGMKLKLEDEVLHLNSDGTGTFLLRGDTYKLNWVRNGSDFSFTDESGDVFTGKYYNGMITGTYFNDYSYTFINDYELYISMLNSNIDVNDISSSGSGTPVVETATSPAVYYTKQTLYEGTYGIKTANALVPYGWSASVSVQWGLCSAMYPAFATVRMVSPDGGAMIEVMSTMGYLQMARNGIWVAEGIYLDLYNIYLNYRNAHDYNDFVLGQLGYKGTIMSEEKPSYEFQLELNGGANAYLSAMSSPNGIEPASCEGSYEKTTYFITEGNAYEVAISSTVIMAETINGMFDTYSWVVPYTATFTAYDESAYGKYHQIFDNVVANTSFCGEFTYVVQRNAQYITEMIHNYLMEKVYTPSSGDISGWDSEYVDEGNDKFINDWCDVIKEQNEYSTVSGDSIKVPTAYDTVYQDGDMIYMGPEAYAPEGWTQLNKR